MNDDLDFSGLDDPMPPYGDREKLGAAMTRGRTLRARRRAAWVAGMTAAVLVTAGGALAVTATSTSGHTGDTLDVPTTADSASPTPTTSAHHKARPKRTPPSVTVAIDPGRTATHPSSGTTATGCSAPTPAASPSDTPPPSSSPDATMLPTQAAPSSTADESPQPGATGSPAADPDTGGCGPSPSSTDQPTATPTSTDQPTATPTHTP